jgi:hypothetical protein
MQKNTEYLLCSECFQDEGIRLLSLKYGEAEFETLCTSCMKSKGAKLTKEVLQKIGHSFFVKGTTHKTDYGHAPIIQCNDKREESDTFNFPPSLDHDLKLIEKQSDLKFFLYGPRTWMLGCITPLIKLQKAETQHEIVNRIIKEYPIVELKPEDRFYRLRKNPCDHATDTAFDSPPQEIASNARFSHCRFPVLYASQDLEVCVHECRVTAEDELFVATLSANNIIRLLDLTHHVKEDTNEFESLDISVQMLFAAGKHSYPITSAIATEAFAKGLDGIIYPSYFTALRVGFSPFDSAGYGLCMRIIPGYEDFLEHHKIPNIVIFGNPIKEKKLLVRNINRLLLNRIVYDINFGPNEGF